MEAFTMRYKQASPANSGERIDEMGADDRCCTDSGELPFFFIGMMAADRSQPETIKVMPESRLRSITPNLRTKSATAKLNVRKEWPTPPLMLDR
jgi:hypothetical protein